MDRNRPRSRDKNVTGGGKGVFRRGSGLGTGGPIGNAGGYRERRSGRSSGGQRGSGLPMGGGGGSLLPLILAAIVILGGGGGLLGNLLGGSENGSGELSGQTSYEQYSPQSGDSGSWGSNDPWSSGSSGGLGGSGSWSSGWDSGDPWGLGGGGGSWGFGSGGSLGSGSYGSGSGSSGSNGWLDGGENLGKLDTSLAPGSRAKRTKLAGNGQDTVTIMVYMCGTDLESKSGMGTSDLQEMAAAHISDKVNLLVFTGGCSRWRNQVISSKVNQIYQIKDGGLACLVQNAGSDPMTDPDTLAGYIRWYAENFPANRNELILWDHGGGSISGYGYDKKYPRSGSMSLAGINTALKNGGVTFDFIGFDACLMATMENALVLGQYADYMIASEETEPGVGWYYTNWLNRLSENTSLSTLEVGRQIVDDFISVCNQKCRGQQTTLSLVDLAELDTTGPKALAAFSQSTGDLIRGQEYRTVSNARHQAREFARSVGIDQVDLIHLAKNMGTEEGQTLASVLESAVKYNRTSSNMTNAYGLAIYFPYKKISSVDKMVQTYEAIGMDEEYTRCIKQFASMEIGGQTTAGGTGSPLPSLTGTMLEGGSTINSADLVTQLLGSLLMGNVEGIDGLSSANTAFLDGRMIEDSAQYLTDNRFDESQLIWQENAEGQTVLTLPEDQWDLIQNLELNVFYDDGSGYIDLGLDNVFDFDEDGSLIGDYDHTWLSINDQPVAYYFLDMTDDGENYTINGQIPALLNDQRVDLILTFDNEHPYGYIAGARTNYDEEVTDTVSRGLTELQAGDRLDFLCDYYSYDGEFLDNYYLGDPMTVEDEMTISNTRIGDGSVLATFRLTDIYNRHYWTPPVE